jgi:hypothetical protein
MYLPSVIFVVRTSVLIVTVLAISEAFHCLKSNVNKEHDDQDVKEGTQANDREEANATPKKKFPMMR